MGDEVQDLLDLGLEGKRLFVHGVLIPVLARRK